jgi:hypothetical protein
MELSVHRVHVRTKLIVKNGWFQATAGSTWYLHSCGILHSMAIEVAGQPIGPIFKGQAVQEDGTNRLSQKVGNKLAFICPA